MALSLMPVRVATADYVDDVVVQLEDQGFGLIEVTRTLLGRTRIVASNGNGNGTRELILNARTGEILRDVWMNSSGQSSPGLVNGSEGTPGDDDGNEDDDHGGNDDNRGHGSDDSRGGDSGGDDHGGDDSGESDDD